MKIIGVKFETNKYFIYLFVYCGFDHDYCICQRDEVSGKQRKRDKGRKEKEGHLKEIAKMNKEKIIIRKQEY